MGTTSRIVTATATLAMFLRLWAARLVCAAGGAAEVAPLRAKAPPSQQRQLQTMTASAAVLQQQQRPYRVEATPLYAVVARAAPRSLVAGRLPVAAGQARRSLQHGRDAPRMPSLSCLRNPRGRQARFVRGFAPFFTCNQCPQRSRVLCRCSKTVMTFGRQPQLQLPRLGVPAPGPNRRHYYEFRSCPPARRNSRSLTDRHSGRQGQLYLRHRGVLRLSQPGTVAQAPLRRLHHGHALHLQPQASCATVRRNLGRPPVHPVHKGHTCSRPPPKAPCPQPPLCQRLLSWCRVLPPRAGDLAVST